MGDDREDFDDGYNEHGVDRQGQTLDKLPVKDTSKS